MAYQSVFKRYELKYMLTRAQQERLLQAMQSYMALDRYGRDTIRNVYFDTENYRLIRSSLERPVYKEKLRLRSYRQAEPDSPVYVELKKKYQGVVYKRRVCMPSQQASAWLLDGGSREESQIAREIDYFRQYYAGLRPVVFLSYEREAFYSRDGTDFRVTFDDHILCRREDLSLESPVWGTELLEPGKVLMEIKTSGGIPMWMTEVLSRERIYKTSFSKYGTAYRTLIYQKSKGDFSYA